MEVKIEGHRRKRRDEGRLWRWRAYREIITREGKQCRKMERANLKEGS